MHIHSKYYDSPSHMYSMHTLIYIFMQFIAASPLLKRLEETRDSRRNPWCNRENLQKLVITQTGMLGLWYSDYVHFTKLRLWHLNIFAFCVKILLILDYGRHAYKTYKCNGTEKHKTVPGIYLLKCAIFRYFTFTFQAFSGCFYPEQSALVLKQTISVS